jgi:hypothetical protein
VLGAAHAALAAKGGVAGDARAEKALVSLLLAPLGKCAPVEVLGLSNFPPLMGLLAPRTHKDVAIRVGAAAKPARANSHPSQPTGQPLLPASAAPAVSRPASLAAGRPGPPF